MEKTREIYDLQAIKDRLSFLEMFSREAQPPRRAGANWVGICPFHNEKTPSFTIFGEGDGSSRRGKCFGCGWSGDVIDFWKDARSVDFPTAVAQLGGLTGLSPRVEGVEWSKSRKVESRRESPEMVKAPMPPLSLPTQAELETLAEIRGLQVEGLECAVAAGRLRCADWPQFLRSGKWACGEEIFRSWVVTDADRWVAQYRRLDGRPYEIRSKGQEPRLSKSWSTKNPSWPIGAGEIAGVDAVLLVEGGADMLAAYHFLWGFELLDRVGVVCMLGASNRIADAALDFFTGKRVRIVMDADELKPDREGRERAPGMDAALRWQNQLTEAGAAVSTFSLYGLETARGAVVKDLNDLALCSAETLSDREILDCFFDWDF